MNGFCVIIRSNAMIAISSNKNERRKNNFNKINIWMKPNPMITSKRRIYKSLSLNCCCGISKSISTTGTGIYIILSFSDFVFCVFVFYLARDSFGSVPTCRCLRYLFIFLYDSGGLARVNFEIIVTNGNTAPAENIHDDVNCMQLN